MNIDWLEWLGYLASILVLVSLLMGSIIKLRWINLAGSGIFSLYGFLIGAYPVALLNLATVCINIYYLRKIYTSQEDFKILPLEVNSVHFNYFFDYYQSSIYNHTDIREFKPENFEISFFILRDMAPAGIFLGSKQDENTLRIELDYVVPKYRDFKVGNYIYTNMAHYFLDHGYSKLTSCSSKEEHIKYLEKMGFQKVGKEEEKTCFVKELK